MIMLNARHLNAMEDTTVGSMVEPTNEQDSNVREYVSRVDAGPQRACVAHTGREAEKASVAPATGIASQRSCDGDAVGSETPSFMLDGA